MFPYGCLFYDVPLQSYKVHGEEFSFLNISLQQSNLQTSPHMEKLECMIVYCIMYLASCSAFVFLSMPTRCAILLG